jgi:hypothetical protein
MTAPPQWESSVCAATQSGRRCTVIGDDGELSDCPRGRANIHRLISRYEYHSESFVAFPALGLRVVIVILQKL